MSNRDTQFQNFAKLLIRELDAVSTTTYASFDKAREAYELAITRRAYDLVEHSCIAINNTQVKQLGMSLHPNAMMRAIPDLTELPKEQE